MAKNSKEKVGADVLFLIKHCWSCGSIPEYRRHGDETEYRYITISCSNSDCLVQPFVKSWNEHTGIRNWNSVQEIRGREIRDVVMDRIKNG